MRRYPQVYEGGGVEIDIKNGEILSFACCDCGLVHDIAFAIEENGKLGIAMKRNIVQTSRWRRMRKPKFADRKKTNENAARI